MLCRISKNHFSGRKSTFSYRHTLMGWVVILLAGRWYSWGGCNTAHLLRINRSTSLWRTHIIFFVNKVLSTYKITQKTASRNFKWKSTNYCKIHVYYRHHFLINICLQFKHSSKTITSINNSSRYLWGGGKVPRLWTPTPPNYNRFFLIFFS